MAKNIDQKPFANVIPANQETNKIKDINDFMLYYNIYNIYCQFKCFIAEYNAELTD
jgi:hypothetical protein